MTFTLDQFRKPLQGNLNDKITFVLTFALWVVIWVLIISALRTTFFPASGSTHWTELVAAVIISIAAFSVRFKRT